MSTDTNHNIMALKFFDDESNGDGSLPFANDYLEENPRANKQSFPVVEAYRTQSNKGYLFKTDKFAAFLFKNQKTAKQIIEALEYYCANQDGYCLVIVLDKSAKNSCRFAVDFDVPTSWFTSGNERFSTQELDLGLDINGNANPFLPPVPSTPLEEREPVKFRTSNGRGGSKGTVANAPSAS